MSADSSGNGHRLNTIRPSISQGAFRGGGVRRSQIQKSREAVKRLNRLAPNLAHMCRFIWESAYAKQIAPRDTRGGGGHLGVLGGQQFQNIGKLSNGCTDWHKMWYTSADSSGNGHRLNASRPLLSRGHIGGFRLSQIQKSNGWTDWHHIWHTFADSSGN